MSHRREDAGQLIGSAPGMYYEKVYSGVGCLCGEKTAHLRHFWMVLVCGLLWKFK